MNSTQSLASLAMGSCGLALPKIHSPAIPGVAAGVGDCSAAAGLGSVAAEELAAPSACAGAVPDISVLWVQRYMRCGVCGAAGWLLDRVSIRVFMQSADSRRALTSVENSIESTPHPSVLKRLCTLRGAGRTKGGGGGGSGQKKRFGKGCGPWSKRRGGVGA